MDRRPEAWRRLLALGAAAAVVVGACAGPTGGTPDRWPDPPASRPAVDLELVLPEGLERATGTETVTFHPDLRVCELVFRAWPNKPATAEGGSSLEVTGVEVGGTEVVPVVEPAGAPRGAPGSLVTAPLPACVDAGEAVTATLTFSARLGTGVDERVGRSASGDLAWLGTAFPLLAWENGRGWATDDAEDVAGEMATSEEFDLRSLTVVAPSELQVLGTGERGASTPAGPGTTAHRFSAPAVRDVTVTVGSLDVAEREVAGTRLHVGVPRGSGQPLDEWTDQTARALADVAAYLGPVPYADVWVSVIPDQTDGIEFPGAMQLGDLSLRRESWLIRHEVAHLWFYGLVGNNQARDPWLDESFASFVEAVVGDPDRDPDPSEDYPRRAVGRMGLPMSSWAKSDDPTGAYVDAIYVAGSDALVEARDAAGHEAFDAALRAYLVTNAHAVATPQDVEAAFADLPAALEVLREAGAL